MSLDPRTTIIGRSSQSKSGDSAYDLKQLQQNFTSLQAEKLDATREMKRLQQSLSELDAKYQLSCEQVKIIAQKSKESNHSHVSSLDQLMKIMEERSSAFKMQEDAWKRAETEKVAIIKGLEEKLRSNAGGPRLSTSTGEVVVLREKVLLLEVKLAEVYSRKSISETGKDLEMSKVKQQLAEILSRNQELEQQRDVIKHASESQHVVIENLEKKLLNAETFSKDAVKTIKMLETKVSTLSAGQESIDSLKQKLFSAETSLAISSAKLQDAESQKRQVMAMLKQNMELLEGNRQSSLKVLTGLKAKVEELTEANQALLAGQARPNVDSQALSSKILLIEEKLAKADMENIALQQNIEVLKAKLQSSDERQQRMTEEMKLREDSAKAQDHSITEKFSTEIQELRQKELHFVSETKKLILQLTELQTEKDTYALQVIELQTKIVEIEKFEKAVIEKNLDFQEQITELEIKHKNTLDEKSKEQEAVVLRLTKEISKLEQVVEKNSETDKSRAEVVSRLKEAVTRLEGVVEKLESEKTVLTANITILKKGKAILQDEVSNLKIELAKRTGVESNLGKVEQNLMILNSENQSLTAQVSKLETNNTNLSLELASFKKLNDQKPVVEQAPIPSSMIRANKLLKARNLLILKNLQDIEAERIHAIARLSNLHQLGTEELKVLNELDLMSDLEGEEGVKDFVYEFLF